MRRIWHEESGSAALTLTWFMLTALLLAIAIDSFLGVYIARQQGQTAADAATYAVTRAIAIRLPEEVRIDATKRVGTIISDPIALANIDAFIKQLDVDQSTCGADPCSPKTPEEIEQEIRTKKISEYTLAFTRHYRGVLDRDMAEKIVDGTWSQSEDYVLRDQLIPDEQDLACLVIATSQKYETEILDQAAHFAELNRASLDRTRSAIGLDGGVHRIVVKRTAHPFGAAWIFPDGDLLALHVQNDVTMSRTGVRVPQYPPHC